MKWYITHTQYAVLVGKKSSKTKTAGTYAPTQQYMRTGTRDNLFCIVYMHYVRTNAYNVFFIV
jgi:hypothetical protein